jgi:hypothetical protein
MASTRKKRDYESRGVTREGVGLLTEAAYRQWQLGPRFKPYWDAFEAGFLNSDAFEPGKRYEEFEYVYNHILEGEAGGRRKYSGDNVQHHFTTSLDWHCWILFKIAHENTVSFDGCFAGKQLSKCEIHRRIWNTIKNEMRSRSLASKSGGQKGKRRLGSDRLSPDNPSADEVESDDDGDLDPSSGTAYVWWTNIPPNALMSGCKAVVKVDGFCGLNETQFEAHAYKSLQLEQLHQEIRRITSRSNHSFPRSKKLASKGNIVHYDVETGDAVVPAQFKQHPPTQLSDPQEIDIQDSDRRQTEWNEMVVEATLLDASRLDLSVRLWKFHFLRSLGKSTTGLIIDDVVLDLGSEHDIINGIQVSCHPSECCQRLTRLLV